MELQYRVAFKEIHNVLISGWDPLGIKDAPEAQDEYDSYVPEIFQLIVNGATEQEVASHLETIAQDSIGLPPYPSREVRNLPVAQKLLEVLKWCNPET